MHRIQRCGVRRYHDSSSVEQHAVLVSEQVYMDTHRKFREKGKPTPAFVLRSAVQHGLWLYASHRIPIIVGITSCRCRLRGDPYCSNGPILGHNRRKQQYCPFAGQFGLLPRGVPGPGTDGGCRRCADRNCPYVLPTLSQFEKLQATFFNCKFPHSGFPLRSSLLENLLETLFAPTDWDQQVWITWRHRRRGPAAATRCRQAGPSPISRRSWGSGSVPD